MKSIKKISFEAKCHLEGSWGSRSIGMQPCTMELFDDGNGDALIEFVAGDNVEHIGIVYNKHKRIIDYDGVHSIPGQAIDLLEEEGYNIQDIE